MKLAVLGATGRTGRHIVQQALAAGHHVRVLVRSPGKLGITNDKLEVLTGDATDAAAVRALVQDRDAVISTLGPVPERADVCSTATRHVIAAGAQRYVAVSGAGLDVPGDQKDLPGRVVSFLVRKLSPAIFADKVLEHQLLASSSLAWTLVRPPRLTDTAKTTKAKSSLLSAPGSSISRAQLAAFALDCAGDGSLIGKAPFVSG